jgi:hypothetical protein
MDAAARSFEAAQLGEENPPRWQQENAGSRPLPGDAISSFVLGSAKKRTNLPYSLPLRETSISGTTTDEWLTHSLLS